MTGKETGRHYLLERILKISWKIFPGKVEMLHVSEHGGYAHCPSIKLLP